MDAALQAKIDELAAAAAGIKTEELIPALHRAHKEALLATESAKTFPVPNMPLGDLAKLIAFLNDGGSVPDMQDIYQRLRKAVADKDQPAFWRSLFLLFKSFRQQNPYLDQQ